MDFYHIVDTQTGKSAFDSIKQLKAEKDLTPLFPGLHWNHPFLRMLNLLFPGLTGTPYSVIIDEEGQIRFRGHFTKGKAPWQEKLNRHYGGFITSLVNQSCEVPPPLQIKETCTGDKYPLTKAGLRIVHSEGASCYDQDQVYKRCLDQNELFQMAKVEAKSMNKDLLLIYGYDNCGWCRAIHNLMYFSDEAQKFQDAFLIRTIAKSSGNDTGKQLIEGLRSSHDITGKFGVPYLIRIDSQTGEPKDFILAEPLEQDFESWGWQGHSLEKVMERLLNPNN